MRLPASLLTFVLLVGQTHAWTQTPVGGEFQVNSYTTAGQTRPSVAVDPAGNFVVVWASYGSAGTDASSASVQLQRYAADGTPLGGEFQVNTVTTGAQNGPSVAMDEAGNFVVVWHSQGSSGTDISFWSVQGRRFASDGTPAGDDFQINTYTVSNQREPSIAMNADGNFVVVWHTYQSPGPDTSDWSIRGQRFDPDAVPLGSEFQVNTYSTGFQRSPSVGIDAGGNFVAVWQSDGSAGSDSLFSSVQGQRFDSDGNPAGAEFQVNSYTTSFQYGPSVAMDSDGDFVVVWESVGQDGSSYGIFGQRFAANGAALGAEFQVNTYTTQNQDRASVATDPAGDFVVVWASDVGDADSGGVVGQRYRVTASIGDRVWSDVNVNGLQDPGESGVSGIVVNLYDGPGDLLESTTTDPDGLYRFERLTPGDYFVEFILPAGFVFTVPHAGADDTIDSDADPVTGRTPVTPLVEGEDDLSWDAGMVGTSLGDRVWLDANVNGLQDAGEEGISGVTVRLYAAAGAQLASAVSDAQGLYRFQGLVPGDYFVEFLVPEGFLFTARDQGADDTVDSDADPATGRTAVTTLSENEMDLSLDSGLAPDDFVTLGVNRSAFSAGETLQVSVLVNNPGAALALDFYFGALLPDGDTIVFFTDLAFNVGMGSLSDVSTLSPIATGVDLSAPFIFHGPSFFQYAWSGGEPRGSYLLFLAAVVPGGFADGTVDPGDILALSTAALTFTP